MEVSKVSRIKERLHRNMAPYYNEGRLPFVPVAAKGEWIYAIREDESGNDIFQAFLDLHGNYSAIGLGHNHPEIAELKIQRLLENRPALISIGEALLEEAKDLAEKIALLSGLDRVVFKNVGTEPFDSAVKTATLWGHKVKKIAENEAVEIITAYDNFHGRSYAATAASTTSRRKDGFGPFNPQFKHVPFGDIEALEAAITPSTGAVILEPIQAEAGVIVPPYGYLIEVGLLCRKHNILFILDEVQTGMGRTGKLFAWEHEGGRARPGGLMLGKNLGGGANIISMLLLQLSVAKLLGPGKEGSTFGGNAEACAVALKTLEILLRPGFLKKVEILGDRFMAELKNLNSPLAREVRGKGLLIAVEFFPEAGGAKHVQEFLFRAGILSLARGEHTIGFSPPLTINEHNLLAFGVNRIKKAFGELEKERGLGNKNAFEN